MVAPETKPARLADAAELEAFLDAHAVALVEFYTAGCAMCQAMEPVLGNVARATGVPIATINPGADVALADRFDVRSVPTLVLLEGDEEVARLADGFQGTEDVVSWLETHVPDAVEAM